MHYGRASNVIEKYKVCKKQKIIWIYGKHDIWDTISNSAVSSVKDVAILDPNLSKEIWQSFYLDKNKGRRIKPNVVLLKSTDMSVYFQTNSHGFKGPDIDFTKKLIAVWGDSVVFGIGRGWVEGLDNLFSSYQFLNGGIEGDSFENISERALEANQKMNIKYNIIFPGWHSRRNPKKVNDLLEEITEKLPSSILCTVPTSLSNAIVERDLSPYFITSGVGVNPVTNYIPLAMNHEYRFWGKNPYSIDNAKKLLSELQQQNDIIRNISSKKHIPLIDLYEQFYTEDLAKFRNDFFDAGHPRSASYPKLQKIIKEALKDVLV
jgi:lysophospholipase L1-like esterase